MRPVCPQHGRPMEPGVYHGSWRCPECVVRTRAWLAHIFAVVLMEPANQRGRE